jgi:hypothetical protein
MWKRFQVLAAAVGLLAMTAAAGLAAEVPRGEGGTGIPKGSYSASCTCQLSGGMYLMCFCNNVEAKYFQTTMDLRSCPAPKDIKNCNGQLTCTEGASAACPGK